MKTWGVFLHERFAKFQLLEKIDEGGMAEIFLARPLDAAFSKLVAVKRILPKHLEDPSFLEMFRREGAIALRFRHPHIIGVHEMGQSADGQLYMSMEYFPGKTLNKIMSDKKSALDVLDKVLIVKNIADALQYIHDFKDYGDLTEIIHRDISPHNIMIGFDGGTRLIDFGIAKLSLETTNSSSLKGKVAYMSPEQVRGEKVTKQTDVFSLGIVLWELLAGRKLFTGSTLKEVMNKVKQCEIPQLTDIAPDVPVKLSWVCQRALAKNVNYRFKSAEEFASELDDVLRMSNDEASEKRLARAMQSLFPEDVARLKETLKKYEAQDEALARSPGPPKPPAHTGTGKQKLRKTKTRRRWAVSAAVVLVLACILLISVEHGLKEKPLKPRPQAKEFAREPAPAVEPTAVPMTTPTPLPTATTAMTTPAPKPTGGEGTPSSAPIAEHTLPKQAIPPAPPQPPARPNPVLAKPALPKAPPAQTAVAGPGTDSTPPSKPAPLLTTRGRKSSRNKIERKTASRPAVQAIAFLTVLADPNAKILVNGKPAGTEVVNDMKVPADKQITVRVISGGGEQSKTLVLKPYSHNVVEFSAGAAN